MTGRMNSAAATAAGFLFTLDRGVQQIAPTPIKATVEVMNVIK
jgi:hypothetical protein